MTQAEPGAASGPSVGSLEALAVHLRAAKLAFGASELLDANRLLLRLRRAPRGPLTREELQPYLRAVFCKRADDQRAFDAAFKLWLGNLPAPEAAAPLADDSSMGDAPAKELWWRRLARVFAVVIPAASLVAAGILFTRPSQEAPVGRHAKPTPAVSGAPVSVPVPAPSSSSSAPPGTAAKPVQPDKPPDQHYVYEARTGRKLRPGWTLGLMAVLLLPLLLVRLPATVLACRHGRSGDKLQLDTRQLESWASKLVPLVQGDTAGRLARHVRGQDADPRRLARRPAIDVRRSVEATLANLGVPTLRHRNAALRPSYVMLVDGEIATDPRARLFYQWAKRLMNEGWDVEIRLFRRASTSLAHAPRVYRVESTGWAESREVNVPLDHFADPPVGQRLIVLSDGACLADANGDLAPWLLGALFKRWRERVVFTPVQMRNWGARELGIEKRENPADPGFLVLPLDEPALEAWALFLSTGQLASFVLSEPDRYPPRLDGRDDEVRDLRTPPPYLDALLLELKLYLGDTGFRWLAALAVPPLVRWELTLLIGKTLIDAQWAKAMATGPARESGGAKALLLSTNYRRLARLSWFRAGVSADGRAVEPMMPDWLRLRLLHELTPGAAAQVREVVRDALGSAQPKPGAQGLELALELPPTPQIGQSEASTRAEGDGLYLGYMSGLSARQLELRAPTAWSSWLRGLGLQHRDSLGSRLTEWLAARWAKFAFRQGLAAFGARRNWQTLLVGSLGGWIVAVAVLLTLELPSFWETTLFDNGSEAIGWSSRPITDLAFSADGSRLVVMDKDGVARIFDAATGRELGRWNGPSYTSRSKLSRGGARVITWGRDACDLWDTQSGARLTGWRGLGGTIAHADLSADGKRWAFSDGDMASVRDASGKTLLTYSQEGESPISWLSLDGSGSRVAIASSRLITVLSVPDGERLGTLSVTPYSEYPEPPALLSPDGKQLALPSGLFYRVAQYGPSPELGITRVDGLKLDATGQALSASQRAGEQLLGAGVWSNSTEEQFASLRLEKARISALRFAPDGARAAVVLSPDDEVRLLSLTMDAAKTDPTTAKVAPVRSRKWLVDAGWFLTGRVWDLRIVLAIAVTLGIVAAAVDGLLLRRWVARGSHGR
jgi:WD40 repeat protein